MGESKKAVSIVALRSKRHNGESIMKRALTLAILAFSISAVHANADEPFPLTHSAWTDLQVLRKNEAFYTYCFATTGPGAKLPDAISKAQSLEGSRLVYSDCAGEQLIAPEHLFQLGLMYCHRESLNPEWRKIESGFSKCFGKTPRKAG